MNRLTENRLGVAIGLAAGALMVMALMLAYRCG